jgi:hypothetical protein
LVKFCKEFKKVIEGFSIVDAEKLKAVCPRVNGFDF